MIIPYRKSLYPFWEWVPFTQGFFVPSLIAIDPVVLFYRTFLGHLSWPIAMGWRPSSSVVRRALTFSSQELLSQSLKNLVCSICRVRRQEIANFMTPPTQRGCKFGVKSVKSMYFFKNRLLYSRTWFRQNKLIVVMTKEGSTKIVDFMTHGAGVLELGRGHINQIVKMHYSFENLLLYFHA